ncbi:thymopoietin a isoform X2 [Gadus morhua]|uniref:Thymopoietin n=1 Tax=Gadus morhua TaxID=8049 RepID=A0A8C5F4A4_GADMO|nr:lamina-associated polypeptide 2, isoforms beta/gamma-like isoform X2 [Gadus morhua]
MPHYLEDPSVLTKEKLKNELLINNVELPVSSAPKDVYVQLYLKHLTVQNTRSGGALDGGTTLDGFSSDEDLPPPVVVSRSSGRKAIRKTDKVQMEDLDVAELTAEGLKEELMKYGVDAGPIVASTRRVYEKKLQRLQEENISPATPELPPIVMETEAHHNGHADLDFSDKEDEEVLVVPVPEPEVIPEPEPLPEPIPIVERLVRSRGKIPVTTRTRSSQHHKTSDSSVDEEVLNVKRPNRRTSYRVQLVPSLACRTVGPNNVGSVLEPEPQPRPLVSMTQTDPASSPSRNTQRPSEDSATLRPNSVVLKARQPSGGKTPRIKSSGEKTPRIQSSGEKTPKTQPPGASGTPKTHPLGSPGTPKTQPSEVPGPGVKDQSRRTAPPPPPPLLMKGTLDTAVFELRPLIERFDLTPPASPKTQRHSLPPVFSVGGEQAAPCTPVLERINDHVEKGKRHKISPFFPDLSPVRRRGCVAVVTKRPYFDKVEKVVVAEPTQRAEVRDILKEVFANDFNSPSGILASCRKPIRGAAGRPIQPSDFWQDENLLLSPKNLSTTTTTTTSFSETRHRSSNLFPSTHSSSSSSSSSSSAPAAPRLVLAAPPAGHAPAVRRGLSVWLKLFLLVLLVAFLFFVYQTMEAEVLSPFSRSEAEPTGTTEGVA